MSQSQKILMVDDDETLVTAVSIHIEGLGYELEHAPDGECGLRCATENDYALMILDLTMPKLDGIEVLKALRERGRNLPVLVLSSRADEVDRVHGLELGADDYLGKPFGVAELVARVKALLRRAPLAESAQSAQSPQTIEAGDLRIDIDARRVTRSGKEISLKPLEFDLLVFLASSPDRVFTRDQLIELVWGYNSEGYDRAVNTCITRLRAKIEDDPKNPTFVQTVWGVGYRFASSSDIKD